MNPKLYQDILSFVESVGYYLKCEYEEVYYQRMTATDDQLFDFIGSYYMGGSSVPDTARYVVELILMRSRP